MRKYLMQLFAVMAVLVLLLPMQAEAESADSFKVDEEGTVTIVSVHAAADGVASLQFCLEVDAASGTKVEFQFSGNAEVQEYRYDQTAKRLNIYISGTEALFSEETNTLNVGRILIFDGNGGASSATVSVVEDSLQYVYGTQLRTVEDLELPGTVQIGKASQPAATPAPTPAQTSQPAPTQAPAQTSQPAQNPGNNGQEGNPGSQENVGDQGLTAGEEEGTQDSGENSGSAGLAGSGGGSGNGGSRGNGSSSQGNNSGNGALGGNMGTPSPAPQEGDASDEADISMTESDAALEESEDVFSESDLSPGESADREDGEGAGGIDWIFVMAIAAILLFAAVAVAAVVVLNRKPGRAGA